MPRTPRAVPDTAEAERRDFNRRAEPDPGFPPLAPMDVPAADPAADPAVGR
ncbi:hypothetical protein [Kitasatospora purpeofusca]|uniref:hypothetical protein n=1 Tax=Kitasatospora purpeofusca TaxID=67352 RepID=UPI0036D29F2F